MDLKRIISRFAYLCLGFMAMATLMLSLSACDSSAIPKNQTSDGTCTKNFLMSYNKIKGTEYGQSSGDPDELKKTCDSFLRTYGKTAEDCTGFNPADGNPVNLNVKDLRNICASKLQGNYY